MNQEDTKSKTPEKLTSNFIDFCAENQLHDLVFVPREPKPDCEAGNCFSNVQKYVEQFGGQLLMGWNIAVRKNIYIECEAHAVWQNPEGQLLDITPMNEAGRKTLFSHQKDMSVGKTPSRYIPFTNSELVNEYIALRNEFEKIRCSSGDEMQIPKQLMYRIFAIDTVFLQKTGRNDPCSCGSGKKYKLCCGWEN